MDAVRQLEYYTIDDIYNLPDGQRAELMDGELYMMATPSMVHQRLVMEISFRIRDYIGRKKGECQVFPSPFAVFLNADDKNYVEPDISVVCDKSKLIEKGCNGAPDLIMEVVSPSTQQMDYGIKLFKYRPAGVCEYWIINPVTRIVNVYDLENEERTCQYSFNDEISVCIFNGLSIQLSELL